MKRKGSTTSIIIATVAGLAVLGVAGYRMMSGDCSSCDVKAAPQAAVVSTSGDDCCPLKGGCDAEATLVSAGSCDKTSECATACATACETACSGEAKTVATDAKDCETACGTACAGDACGVDAEACCGKCEKGKELAKAPQ